MGAKTQASKRGRNHRKQAKFAGLSKRVGHPTHGNIWQRLKWLQPGQRIVLVDNDDTINS